MKDIITNVVLTLGVIALMLPLSFCQMYGSAAMSDYAAWVQAQQVSLQTPAPPVKRPPNWQPPFNPPKWTLDRLGLENVLPPEQFDHPFVGKVETVIRSMAEILAMCPIGDPIACVVGGLDYCYITRAPDDVIEANGNSVDTVMRHEIGHCNGWDWKHGNGRTWWRYAALPDQWQTAIGKRQLRDTVKAN